MALCQVRSSDNPHGQSVYTFFFSNTGQFSIRKVELQPQDLPVTTIVARTWQRAQQRVLPTQWENTTENNRPMGTTKQIMQFDWENFFRDSRTMERCRYFSRSKSVITQALKDMWHTLPAREKSPVSLSIPLPTPYHIQNIQKFSKNGLLDHVLISYKTPFRRSKYLRIAPHGFYQIVDTQDEFSEIWIQDPILSRGIKENRLPDNFLDTIPILSKRLPIMEERFYNDPMTKESSYFSLYHNTFYTPIPPYKKVNYGSINLSFTHPDEKTEEQFAFCTFVDDKRNTRTLFLNKICYFFLEGLPSISAPFLSRLQKKAKASPNPGKYIREQSSKLEKELFKEAAEKQFQQAFYRLPENAITYPIMDKLLRGSRPWDMVLSLVRKNEIRFQNIPISQELKNKNLFSNPNFSLKEYFYAHQSLPKERIKYQFVDHGTLDIQNVGSFSYCTFKQPNDKTRTIFLNATTRSYFVVHTDIRKGSKVPTPEEIVRRLLTLHFIHPLPEQVFSGLAVDNLQEAQWKMILSAIIDDLILSDEIAAENTLEKVKAFFPKTVTPKSIFLDSEAIQKTRLKILQRKLTKKQLTFQRLSLSTQESSSIPSILSSSKSSLEGYLRPTASIKARFNTKESLPSSRSISRYVAPIEGSENFLQETHSSRQKKKTTRVSKKHSRIPSIPSKDSLKREEGVPPPTPSHKRMVQKKSPPISKIHSFSNVFFSEETTMDPDITHKINKPNCVRCTKGTIYSYLKDTIRDGNSYIEDFNTDLKSNSSILS
jgi:hypothetical protein